MSRPEARRRHAVVQGWAGCDHVVITSRLDGSERIYAIGPSDAYDTKLMPLAGDTASSSVGTRALIEAIDTGKARPCSPVLKREGESR
jgi:hypothetical protein